MWGVGRLEMHGLCNHRSFFVFFLCGHNGLPSSENAVSIPFNFCGDCQYTVASNHFLCFTFWFVTRFHSLSYIYLFIYFCLFLYCYLFAPWPYSQECILKWNFQFIKLMPFHLITCGCQGLSEDNNNLNSWIFCRENVPLHLWWN